MRFFLKIMWSLLLLSTVGFFLPNNKKYYSVKKFKKFFKIVGILSLLSIIVVYWLGSGNYYLGSANYYKTAFEELDTEWVSKDLSTQVKVTKYNLMDDSFCMILNSNKNKYFLRARGHKLLEIYPYTEEFEKGIFGEPKVFKIKYQRHLGDVVGFKIYDINRDNLMSSGEDKIVFRKRRE